MSTDIALTNRSTRLEDSLFSKELAPHYLNLANQLSKSSMIPKNFIGKPMDIYVAMAMGYQLGLPVEQALQDISVVNGRPCLWGDGLLAVIMRHPEFEDINEEPLLVDGVITGYECTIMRKNKSPKKRKFTLDMAKRAGLLSKGGVWSTNPDRMLQLRARSFAIRDSFADALRGMRSREEVEDYIDLNESEWKPVDEDMSRTELIKRDLQNKDNENDAESNHSVSCNKIVSDSTQTNTIYDISSMEEITEQKAEVVGDSGETGLDKIIRLMDETMFSEERLAKALKFYEVNSIKQLTEDQQKHFILQLQK